MSNLDFQALRLTGRGMQGVGLIQLATVLLVAAFNLVAGTNPAPGWFYPVMILACALWGALGSLFVRLGTVNT